MIFFIRESTFIENIPHICYFNNIDQVFKEFKKSIRTNISLAQMSYLDIKYILDLYYNLDNQSLAYF